MGGEREWNGRGEGMEWEKGGRGKAREGQGGERREWERRGKGERGRGESGEKGIGRGEKEGRGMVKERRGKEMEGEEIRGEGRENKIVAKSKIYPKSHQIAPFFYNFLGGMPRNPPSKNTTFLKINLNPRLPTPEIKKS